MGRYLILAIVLFVLFRLLSGGEEGVGEGGALTPLDSTQVSRPHDSTVSEHPTPLTLSESLCPEKNYPQVDTVSLPGGEAICHYTGDSALTARIETYLRRYNPNQAVVLVADLATGKILGMGERRDSVNYSSPHYAFGKRFPAASIIKIVTAYGALRQGIVNDSQDSVLQIGSFHTLYRSQLNKTTGKQVTLNRAFAYSANPAFGLLGVAIGKSKMESYAAQFGFNEKKPWQQRSISQFSFPDSGFERFESGCGFTRSTTISPLHALEMARMVGNDGRRIQTHWVDSIVALSFDTTFYPVTDERQGIKDSKELRELQTMMQSTIRFGTGRKGFYSVLKRSHFDQLVVGGKTGSLDGDDPKGRYDWFIGYAKKKENPSLGIAIAVMFVHQSHTSLRASKFSALVVRDWLRFQRKKNVSG